MRKNVIVCGLIAGFIVSAIMAISMAYYSKNAEHEGGMLLGYASMILAFSLVFVGIKNARDRHGNGYITFGKAFTTGLYITLIASTAYVVTWVIEYYMFIPDFMEKYSAHILKQVQESGASQNEINEQIKEMAGYKEMYKNPLFVILLTYMEILPVGILVVLISSFILKRKNKEEVKVELS